MQPSLGPRVAQTLTPLHCTRHRSPLRGGAQQDAFKVLYKSLDVTDRFSILSDGTRIQLTVYGSDPHPGGWSPGPGTRPDASKHSLSWSSKTGGVTRFSEICCPAPLTCSPSKTSVRKAS